MPKFIVLQTPLSAYLLNMPNNQSSPSHVIRPLMSFEATLPPIDYSSTQCKFYKVGHCKYGTSCQFLHPPTCTIPKCPKTYCPNQHPQQCKRYLKFGSCKFADTCSYSHFAASPPISCPTNSNCDSILLELQTLKSLISSLSTQLNEYGSILSSL